MGELTACRQRFQPNRCTAAHTYAANHLNSSALGFISSVQFLSDLPSSLSMFKSLQNILSPIDQYYKLMDRQSAQSQKDLNSGQHWCWWRGPQFHEPVTQPLSSSSNCTEAKAIQGVSNWQKNFENGVRPFWIRGQHVSQLILQIWLQSFLLKLPTGTHTSF